MRLKILLLNLYLCSLTDAASDDKSRPKQGLEGGLKNLVEKLEFRLRDMETKMQDDKERVEMRMKYEEEKHTTEKKELETRIKEMETKMQEDKERLERRMKYEEEKHAIEKKELETHIKALQAKNKETGTRLEILEDKMNEQMDEIEKREKELEASMSKLRKEVEEKTLRQETAPNNYSNNTLTKPSPRDLPILIISAWQGSDIRSPQTVTFDSFLANYNNAARPGQAF